MRHASHSLPIRHSREKIRPIGRCLLLLTISQIALVLLAGCGYGGAGGTTHRAPSGTSSGTPSGGRATVVVHASSAQADRNAVVTATAHCASGEKLVSGGFAADIFEADAIVASYPSAAGAWTVTGSSPASSITVTAYADCLTNSGGVNVETAHAQGGSASVTANCPAGSILTGGGYQGATPRSSYPTDNGWALESSGRQSATVWALCATRGLTAAPLVTASFILPAGFGASGGASASCGAGQMITGGGFRNDGVYSLIDNALTSDDAGWSVGANANESPSAATPATTPGGTAYAVCVTE